ncbi:unnamed protein product [Musa hybrid cultivar]
MPVQLKWGRSGIRTRHLRLRRKRKSPKKGPNAPFWDGRMGYRHLMLNVVSLVPHCKKDSKVESQESEGATLNELIDLRNCSSWLFFDCRKQKDLYRWMVKCPSGPSVNLLWTSKNLLFLSKVYTMEELKLTGNHLKRSHPILTFSSNFDKVPCIFFSSQVLAYCFIFSIPKDHWKVKPFHDHVFVFPIVDDHIRFRNYQISVPHNEIDKLDRSIEEL